MKKILNTILIGAAMLLLFGCTPSTIVESTAEAFDPGDFIIAKKETKEMMTLPETSKYVIPADAETGENGGPGAMATTAVDYSYYPEDKRVSLESEENGTMVIIYIPSKKGIVDTFDYVDTCDAETLLQAMIRNNALADYIELESFDISEDGKSAYLTISDAVAVYANASEEEIVTAVANTFIDNFGLDEIDVTAGGYDYGMTGFSQEFDAKKKGK